MSNDLKPLMPGAMLPTSARQFWNPIIETAIRSKTGRDGSPRNDPSEPLPPGQVWVLTNADKAFGQPLLFGANPQFRGFGKWPLFHESDGGTMLGIAAEPIRNGEVGDIAGTVGRVHVFGFCQALVNFVSAYGGEGHQWADCLADGNSSLSTGWAGRARIIEPNADRDREEALAWVSLGPGPNWRTVLAKVQSDFAPSGSPGTVRVVGEEDIDDSLDLTVGAGVDWGVPGSEVCYSGLRVLCRTLPGRANLQLLAPAMPPPGVATNQQVHGTGSGGPYTIS